MAEAGAADRVRTGEWPANGSPMHSGPLQHAAACMLLQTAVRARRARAAPELLEYLGR